MEKWILQVFMSGTHIVTRNVPKKPHYYVYGDRRREVCNELADWLNGGEEPYWLSSLKLKEDCVECCVGDENIDITAVGPMILPPNDNGALNWQTDLSDKAKADRIELIQKLLRRTDGLDDK